MISVETLLLFVIMVCVVFMTICMITAIVFLVRYYSTFKKLQEQVELLGKNLNANVVPVVQEVRDTASCVRELIGTAQDSVTDFAWISMIKKVSPKLAGLKLGWDLGVKAYKRYFMGTKGKGHFGQDRYFRKKH